MRHKPVIRRALADEDIQQAIDYYLSENAQEAALKFVDALQQAFTHLSRYPHTGSPRYAHELDLPGLRSWSLTRFPYQVFYIEQADYLDVWRVLHAQRDIPAWMQEAD